MAQGDLVVVPAGKKHNFLNTGQNPLILYTVYGPPEHADGAVHKTKEEADRLEEEGKDEPPRPDPPPRPPAPGAAVARRRPRVVPASVAETPGMTSTADAAPTRCARAGIADVDDSGLARALYSSDASLYRVLPRAVVRPRHVDEIAGHARGLPLPRRAADRAGRGHLDRGQRRRPGRRRSTPAGT